MPDQKDPADSPFIDAADAAAEALIKGSTRDVPTIEPGREAALDAVFAEVSKKPAPPPVTAENFGRDNGGVPLPLQGKPADKPVDKAVSGADTPPVVDTPPVADKPAETSKGLLEDLLATPDASAKSADKPVDDPYGTVKLRSDASPKTRETFEELKRVAKEREQAAILKSDEIRKQLEELQAKTGELEKRTVSDEVQNELKDLRAFRAQFDTERDPDFRSKFDGRIEKNYESVYAKLKTHGLPESEFAKLRSFSVPERDAAIENFLSKLPSFDQKYITAKLLDNVNVFDEREKALAEARSNADVILKKGREAPAVQTAQRDAKVAELLRPALPKLPWLHLKEIPATAAAEERKRLEGENAFAASMQEALKTAIVDDSPAVRAEAAIAVPLARYYQRELASAQEQLKSLQAQLGEIKQAGALSRTARSVGNAGKPPSEAPKAPPANAGDALDQLFSQATGITFR